ncbi:anhydro-N-acetylmuramic acid kinase [Mariniblastus sp.]|nr:anhydro-N-acetylmuramic acid kinase [Mariniblastus sp.]
MLLPFLSRSTQDQGLENPARRIDRTLEDRGHRLTAGLNLTNDFGQIDAVLMVATGHGKYLSIRHSESESHALAKDLRIELKEIASKPDPSLADVRQLATDLAIHQASLFEKIKCRAGKYVDRILAIAVTDPGLWWKDFDGSLQYASLCDPMRLSQLTGTTVIDDFPARDVAAGGQGTCLDALPLWFLHADRAPRIAADHRMVLQLNQQSTGYWLPASDGHDAELPSIGLIGPTPSTEFLNALLSRKCPADSVQQNEIARSAYSSPERLYADGTRNNDLIEQWNNAWTEFLIDAPAERPSTETIDATLIQIVETSAFKAVASKDIVRSAVYWVIELILADVSPARSRADHVYFATESPLTPCLINQFIQAANFDKSRVHCTPPISGATSETSTDAISAATLGLLHIDQMPANVPKLTGATEQRILGRLSMGSPSNWRQLLREMADFQPPAMKLRDAV